MKLQLTSLLLAIAFTASSLSAAGIPQIKAGSPKTPVAPKVVKVPVVAKVPTVPKVPTIAKVPSAPKVPVVKVPAVAKIPTAPKVVAAPKVVSVKTPAVVKVPTVPAKVSSTINTGRLNNLKQTIQIDSSKFAAAGGKGARFVNDHVGPGAGANKPGTFLTGVRQGSGKHDRNPLSGSPLDGMRGDKNSQVSHGGPQRNGAEAARGDSSSKESKNGNTITKWENGTVQVVSADKKTTTTAYPDGTVVETKNGKTTTYDPKGTPLPDDAGTSSGTTVVTRNDLRGLNARKSRTSEPSQDETSGAGGPVNTGANGTGKAGSLSQPVADSLGASAPSLDSALETIRIKVESKINTGGR